MKIVAGLVLLLLGSSLFVLSFLGATRTDTVIDMSFVLEPGETYDVYHHTGVFSKSTLVGGVIVEDEGVNFTVYGYNAQHLENIFTGQDYSFVINPADDLYTFKFKNSMRNVQSSIGFTLEETWLSYFMLIPAFFGLLMVTTGLVIITMSLRARGRLWIRILERAQYIR